MPHSLSDFNMSCETLLRPPDFIIEIFDGDCVHGDTQLDLHCEEVLTLCVDDPVENVTVGPLHTIETVRIKDMRTQELVRIMHSVKNTFHGLKLLDEYKFIQDKRQREIVEIKKMYTAFAYCLFENEMQHNVAIVSTVALLDWMIVERNHFFCDENVQRLACFCVMHFVRTNLMGTRSVWTKKQQHDIIIYLHEAMCMNIYGEITDIYLSETRFCEANMFEVVRSGKYKESSFVKLLEQYYEPMPDQVLETLCLLFADRSCAHMKYKNTDTYEEFVQIFVSNSKNTTENFRVARDYSKLMYY